MHLLGAAALYAALFFAFAGIALSIIAGRTGSRRYLLGSRYAAYATFGAVFTASSVLFHALLTHDFSIQYVANFSDHTMPLFYLMGSFWGGQAGSLLFWASISISFTAAAVYLHRDTYQDFMPWVTATCLACVSGLLLILCFASNPFDTFAIIDDPTTGKGLNPLLQTPKMVVHPPSLLTGMATMVVPFGFAIAALITKNFSSAWVEASRKWILIPWFFLSIGNVLGGMWAYEELGWGGYWAWDPVENASFLPWLTTTALLHSLMIQERRGMLKRWNIGLMIFSYILTIFGTYITRSGLIESVHTFAQSEVGPYFLALLLTITFASLALFFARWSYMKTDQRLDSALSREAAFIFNNWLFLAMAAVVLFGTMWPRIREGIFGQEIAIGPQWFNRWMAPMGLMLLVLMGIGTVISWRKANLKNFKRNFVLPIIAAVVTTPILILGYWYGRGIHLNVTPSPNDATYAIMAVGLSVFVAATTFEEYFRGVMARIRMHQESFLRATIRLVSKQRRRYGGYIIHLGILAAFIAFAGNAVKIEKDVSLQLGESYVLGDYTFTYKGLRERNDPDKRLVIADVDAHRNGKLAHAMTPGKAIFHATPNMPTSEIDIRSTILEDVYVALVDYQPSGQVASFKIFISPFTWWFWFGCAILIFGTFVCLWPTRRELESLRFIPSSMLRVAFVTGLSLMAFMPLVLLAYENSEWGSAARYEKIVERQDPDNPFETVVRWDGS